MIKFATLAATVLLAATGVAASAQEAQQAEQPPEKKICRTERMTGSLTRRTRICMTEREWHDLNDRTRKGVDEMGRSASGGQAVQNNAGPGGPGA